MGFYDLDKEARTKKVADIQQELLEGLRSKTILPFENYFADDDLYIRKAAYLGVGRCYNSEAAVREQCLKFLKILQAHPNELVRQTVINSAGEIGMWQFARVQSFFDHGLTDAHHKVRNAVIGSIKKMSQKNPIPVLQWAATYMNHPEKEIRREVCHGIELRGRTHPQEVLPLLKKLQFEETARVRNTLIHVLGQISYKRGCLETVVHELKHWDDTALVKDALLEIVDVHSEKRYAKFTAKSQEETIAFISKHFDSLNFS